MHTNYLPLPSTCSVHSSVLVRNEESIRRKSSAGQDYTPSIALTVEGETSIWRQGEVGERRSSLTASKYRKVGIHSGNLNTKV